MRVKEGRPCVSDRPGFNEALKRVLGRVSTGEISKRQAARLLGVGTATLYRYAGWAGSESEQEQGASPSGSR